MPSFSSLLTLLLISLFSLAPAVGVAQDQATFNLQLNGAAETTSNSCRLTYVATNQSDQALDKTSFQMGIFDTDGAVTRLLVLEFGALIAGKTKILQFDLGETSCASISRIVVNNVVACTLADGTESDICSQGLVASSRTAIQFGL